MNYLEALVERSVGTAPSIRPRLPTLFEPMAGLPLGEALTTAGLPSERLVEIAADAPEGPMGGVSQSAPPMQSRTASKRSVPAPSAHGRIGPASPDESLRTIPALDTMRRPERPAEVPSPRPVPSGEPRLAAAHLAEVAADMPVGGRIARLQADEGLRALSPAIRPWQETGTPSDGQVATAVSPSHVARPAQAESAAASGQAVGTDATTVHIYIGRVEVRALLQPGPGTPAPPARPAPRRQPLEEYLAGRGGRP